MYPMLTVTASPNPITTEGSLTLTITFDGTPTLLEVLDGTVSRGGLGNPISPITWLLPYTMEDVGSRLVTTRVTRAGVPEVASVLLDVQIPLVITVQPHTNDLPQRGSERWLRDLFLPKNSIVELAPLQNGDAALWFVRTSDKRREKLAVYSSTSLGTTPRQIFTAEAWSLARLVPPKLEVMGVTLEPEAYEVLRGYQQKAADLLRTYVNTGDLPPFLISLIG